jgi:hypothetical protein
MEELPPAELFKKTIARAVVVKKIYTTIIDKDGRISGQKRPQLVEALDTLFIYLVVLRDKLLGNYAPLSQTRSADQVKVPLQKKFNKHVAAGSINQEDLLKITNFAGSFDSRILSKLKELLTKYNELVKAGDKENSFNALASAFDELFYNLLLIRNNLENVSFDR